jgi:tripartite-type tricarboxylate transporter receptor subunit TctC
MKINTLFRRASAALLALSFAALSHAQDYPNRPVRIIVPYAAGGQADSGVRILANALSQQLGKPFVVENIGGSSGISAIQQVMKAPADGYTLMYNDAGHWAINPALFAKLPYDTLRDLAPVGLFGSTALFLVASSSFPANNLQELVALVKAKPDVYTYASSGVGSPHHLTMEDFKAALGLKILHVPYKGTGQSVPALVGGQVSMGIAALTSVSSFAKEGRVKIIAVNSKQRSAFAPNVPPMADAGAPDFDHSAGLAIMAPAGTPRAVIDKLSAAIAKAVALPDTVTRFAAIGLEPASNSSPEHLAETIRNEKPKYARIVKISGAKLD